jgi:hypothetical protein
LGDIESRPEVTENSVVPPMSLKQKWKGGVTPVSSSSRRRRVTREASSHDASSASSASLLRDSMKTGAFATTAG